MKMMVNVEAKREANETSGSLLRRFGKKVVGAEILKTAKGVRYRERPQSEFKKKKYALKRLNRRQEIERLKKLGKLV